MKLQLLLVTFLLSSSSMAALSPIELSKILMKPTEERISTLKSKKASGDLRKMAFDQKVPFPLRWRALTATAQIEQIKSLPMLREAVQHQDWFMRDAGLRAMQEISPETAKQWARQLMSDKALIVRTTAVGVIHDLRDFQSYNLLWSKLYSKENFRKKQSLWIRRHIVEALADMGEKKDTRLFVRLLEDPDKTLQPASIKALQRLTGQKYASAGEWITWGRKNIQ